MKKNLPVIIVVAIVVIAGLFYFGYSYLNRPKVEPVGVILFYGDGCSHCKIVEDFILESKIEEKVEFTKSEVFNNKDNAKLLVEKANICGLPTDKIGVPFLWDGKTCVVGDVDIIKFFQDKANAK
jgi:hypothetical protein